jgi:hypothetical protein
MVNAGNKGMKNAYTIIDMNETPEGILDAVASINGVIRVRLV